MYEKEKNGQLYTIIFPNNTKKKLWFKTYKKVCEYIENECGYIYYTKRNKTITLKNHSGNVKIKLSLLDGNHIT